MPIVRAKEQDVQTGPGGLERRVLATPKKGAKELRVTRGKMQAPLPGSPSHKHDHEEVVVVLGGPVRHKMGDREDRLSAGDVIIIPAGTLHQTILEPGQVYESITIHPAGTKYFGPDGKKMPLPDWAK